MIQKASYLAIIPDLLFLGGRFIIFGSAGSTPKAVAGAPSVTKFIHKICTAIKGKGKPSNMAKKMINTSPELEESR